MKRNTLPVNIIRDPFYGGVMYYDEDSNKCSRAYYPTTETEFSAIKNNLLNIEIDDLNIWANDKTERY